MNREIIHLDMDAFFASIEQLRRPELRGRPLIVGGHPKRRGVVSTCSYEARKFGIHSGMPTRTAMRLCPEVEVILPDFRCYSRISRRIMRILGEYTPRIEAVSIDEAYLDVTGRAPDGAAELAETIRKRIRSETGLTASAGVAPNKFLAKLASDFHKPDGLTVITPENAQGFIDALPIGKFHGIGEVTAAKLRRMNVRTGADLRRLPRETLRAAFGKTGDYYYYCVRGIDDRPVEDHGDPKSLSREVTLYEDWSDLRRIRVMVRILSRKVVRRVREHGFFARNVTLKLKYSDFRSVSRTIALPGTGLSGEEVGSIAVDLLARTEAGSTPVRLIGVGLGGLSPDAEPEFEQLEFELE